MSFSHDAQNVYISGGSFKDDPDPNGTRSTDSFNDIYGSEKRARAPQRGRHPLPIINTTPPQRDQESRVQHRHENEEEDYDQRLSDRPHPLDRNQGFPGPQPLQQSVVVQPATRHTPRQNQPYTEHEFEFVPTHQPLNTINRSFNLLSSTRCPHKSVFSPPALESENLDDPTASSTAHCIWPVDDRTASSIAHCILSNKSLHRKPLVMEQWKAQRLVDISQAVLENPTVDVRSRRALAVSVRQLSESAGVYPRSYDLEGVELGFSMLRRPTRKGAFYAGVYQKRNVCLKALKEDTLTTRVQLLLAVAREAIVWRQLNHPNVLPFYGICQLSIGLCLVSPSWMYHGSLRQYIRGLIPPEERLLIARDVAEGLQYLHSYDIVHGRLDWENILIDATGRARIANFGLTSINAPDIRLTSPTSPVAFRGPESFCHDGDTDPNLKAGDIYAWGCVCYVLYLEQEPYKGSDCEMVFLKLRDAQPERPDDNNPAWREHGLRERMWSLMWETRNADPGGRPDAAEVAKRVSDMIDADLRPKEEHEQGPEANFISRWCRDTYDDLNFKPPSLEEVQELLQIGSSMNSSDSSVYTNDNWEEFTEQTSTSNQDVAGLYLSSPAHRSCPLTAATPGLLRPTATSSRSPSLPGFNDDNPQSISVPNRSPPSPYPPPIQDSPNSRLSPSRVPHQLLDATQAYHEVGVQETKPIFAEFALEFVNRHKEVLEGYLFKLGYEGEYMIQVGFHEELLRLGMRQEMVVYTLFSDFKPSQVEAADVIGKAFAPLIVSIQSPNQNFCIPLELNGLQSEAISASSLSSSWDVVSDKCTTMNTSKTGSHGAQNVNGQSTPAGGSREDKGNLGRNQDGARGGDDENREKGEKEEGDGDTQNTPGPIIGLNYNKPVRRSLGNHLFSLISVPSEPPGIEPQCSFSLDFNFLIEDIDNLEGEDPPLDELLSRKWVGPWACVNLASVGTSSGPTELYTVRTIETKITAAPNSTEILFSYPLRNTHAQTDNARIRAETRSKNKGAARVGITEPLFSLQHENGKAESKEFEHNRWVVKPAVRPQQKGMVFSSQFTHNPIFPPVCSENFIPGPRIGCGYSIGGEQQRVMGISIEVLWSSTVTPGRPKTLLDIFHLFTEGGFQSGRSAQPLIFANFEQRLSFEVELAKLEPGPARMQHPNIIDQVERVDFAGNQKSLPKDMRKVHQTFEIEMQRAIRGEISGKKITRFELDSR